MQKIVYDEANSVTATCIQIQITGSFFGGSGHAFFPFYISHFAEQL